MRNRPALEPHRLAALRPRHATVAVRDSKTPSGRGLTLTPAAFTAFVGWATATATAG
ncbi:MULTISPECIES: DUF397 domain-containing protein [Streptomyces]|uniref:DUF397 domain-containing protein n=1 Tax=Streptomyces rubrogriseus TaxID=194673 RepID=A0ABT4NUX8_9ACTN|nr:MULTISPECIES: DUF397 domain-containing protein [Streptomyces]MBQ0948043.1 DUF397 domain-containing protein [Streptomyces sp. RK76]MCW8121433.1 DUF397 domain-containing protein [Streptomyces anthocyanicus]MCZ4632928.1 DUF397 domain-containing protein [Streptomyces rubrogriseus]THA98137.1 DUF397 domain-containing protein [Streptomyces sp. LRa12]WTC51273.1 DUF397 domain-containing protein [Streptomyces anthocyanicus]